MEELLAEVSQEAEKIIKHFQDGVVSIRGNRATPALVENILVESYGTSLPIKQLASISTSQPNLILIQPWDKTGLKEIERAISQANIGVAPVIDGNLVRVALPPLTGERRKELVKLLKEKSEESRISFRIARDETRKNIQAKFEAKKIGEDEKFRLNELLQKEVNTFNETLDALAKTKEEEILRV